MACKLLKISLVFLIHLIIITMASSHPRIKRPREEPKDKALIHKQYKGKNNATRKRKGEHQDTKDGIKEPKDKTSLYRKYKDTKDATRKRKGANQDTNDGKGFKRSKKQEEKEEDPHLVLTFDIAIPGFEKTAEPLEMSINLLQRRKTSSLTFQRAAMRGQSIPSEKIMKRLACMLSTRSKKRISAGELEFMMQIATARERNHIQEMLHQIPQVIWSTLVCSFLDNKEIGHLMGINRRMRQNLSVEGFHVGKLPLFYNNRKGPRVPCSTFLNRVQKIHDLVLSKDEEDVKKIRLWIQTYKLDVCSIVVEMHLLSKILPLFPRIQGLKVVVRHRRGDKRRRDKPDRVLPTICVLLREHSPQVKHLLIDCRLLHNEAYNPIFAGEHDDEKGMPECELSRFETLHIQMERVIPRWDVNDKDTIMNCIPGPAFAQVEYHTYIQSRRSSTDRIDTYERTNSVVKHTIRAPDTFKILHIPAKRL